MGEAADDAAAATDRLAGGLGHDLDADDGLARGLSRLPGEEEDVEAVGQDEQVADDQDEQAEGIGDGAADGDQDEDRDVGDEDDRPVHEVGEEALDPVGQLAGGWTTDGRAVGRRTATGDVTVGGAGDAVPGGRGAGRRSRRWETGRRGRRRRSGSLLGRVPLPVGCLPPARALRNVAHDFPTFLIISGCGDATTADEDVGTKPAEAGTRLGQMSVVNR